MSMEISAVVTYIPFFFVFLPLNNITTMKRIMLFVAASIFFAACQDEPDEPINPNAPIEYPATADVIYDAVTDYDGNTYDAVRIGSQVWMAANLRTTHYANGEPVEGHSPSTNTSKYGLLYDWHTTMHGANSSSNNPSGVQGICPNGWHVPSDAEWTQMTSYLSSHSEYVCGGDDANIAKSLAATHGWQRADDQYAVGCDLSANNATGFSARPAGNYYNNYFETEYAAYFWSTTENHSTTAYNRYLYYNVPSVRRNDDYKTYGYSVRCVRD